MVEKARSNLKFYDRQIARLLLKHGGSMTPNQIAENLKISWNTAEKHLKNLEDIGLVESSGDGKRLIWRVWEERQKRRKRQRIRA